MQCEVDRPGYQPGTQKQWQYPLCESLSLEMSTHILSVCSFHGPKYLRLSADCSLFDTPQVKE